MDGLSKFLSQDIQGLENGTAEERNRWRLIGLGSGIHWPDLDEDLSAQNLLEGKPSLEGERSFQSWLNKRSAAKKFV